MHRVEKIPATVEIPSIWAFPSVLKWLQLIEL